nr:PREDICTED: uncharacterized protein LOC105272439 [Fopius arisanus]
MAKREPEKVANSRKSIKAVDHNEGFGHFTIVNRNSKIKRIAPNLFLFFYYIDEENVQLCWRKNEVNSRELCHHRILKMQIPFQKNLKMSETYMGKKSKRSRKRDELLERLLNKVQNIEEKLEILPDNSENKAPNNQENLEEHTRNTPESSTSVSEALVDMTAEENREDEPNEDWIKFLGDDPTSSQAEKLHINGDLLKRWVFFCKEGVKKEDLESLMSKYACVWELETPKLNAQIAAAMKDIAIVRDKHMVEIQKMAGTALSILGSVVTNIYQESNDFDLEKFLTRIRDSEKILTAIIQKQSYTRKAFIEPV